MSNIQVPNGGTKIWSDEYGKIIRKEGDGNPVHIDDYRPHSISEVVCLKCLNRWVAIRPKGTPLKNLECSNCGCGFVIETGEVIE